MWSLYRTAKGFQVRPSELLAVQDRYAAYCLDTAVGEFGRALEAELKSVEGKNKKELQTKTQRILMRWLDEEPRFRDPVKAGLVQLPTRTED